MPTINYEHTDFNVQCSLGKQFQMFRGVNACELKVCDNCSKPIREVIKKSATPMPPASGGTTSQSITG